jgi:hypothetical protein
MGLCQDSAAVEAARCDFRNTATSEAMGGGDPDFVSFQTYGPGQGLGCTLAVVLSMGAEAHSILPGELSG